MIKEAVRGIRNVRTGMNVPPSKKAKVFVVSESENVRNTFENGKYSLQPLEVQAK